MADRLQWTSPPNYRGTPNVLWTCLSTIGLGVWTAIHPNVRADGRWLKLTLERLGEMMLAIVLPEVIICSAWQQLLTAKRICTELTKLQQPRDLMKTKTPYLKPDSETEGMLKKRTTSTYNSSLESPGQNRNQSESSVAIDEPALHCTEVSPELCDEGLSDTSREATRNGDIVSQRLEERVITKDKGHSNETRDSITPIKWSMRQAFFVTMGGFIVETPELGAQHVTTEGILTLAKVGLLPNLSDKDVEDRNKADTIAKGLVVIQLSWFLVQVLSRLVSGLPITLLEAHTSVHVGFTMLIFALWFKKPYNVQYPIPLQGNDSIDMACLFEFDARRRQAFNTKLGQHKQQQDVCSISLASGDVENRFESDQDSSTPPKLEPLTQSLSRHKLRLGELDGQNHDRGSHSGQDVKILTMLQGASRAINRLSRYEYSTEMIDTQRWDFLRPSSIHFTIGSTWGAWSQDEGHKISLDKVMHMIFNILYGTGHLTAWRSSSFPSVQEKWMWRASALMLCSIPVWGLLWILWWKAVGSTRKILWPFRNGDLDHVAAPLFLNVLCGCVFARCFFLIECLVSLRSQPAGAYQIERWTAMVPHVG